MNKEKTANKERVQFYFDTAKYTLKLRQYHALISFANDVLREINKCGIYPTNELLRGLLNVREDRQELIAQTTQGVGVKMRDMYTIILCADEQAEKAWETFVNDNLSVQAKPMHNMLRKQFAKAYEGLLQTCYTIKQKYTQGNRTALFSDLDFNCIEYDDKTKDVHLSSETIAQAKSECYVYAESERAESVYKGLLEVAEKLNAIMENLNHPSQIFDAFEFDTISGQIEVVKNFDFNLL